MTIVSLGSAWIERFDAIRPLADTPRLHKGWVRADYLIKTLGRERFAWGDTSRATTEKLRGAYLVCLRAADDGNLSDLMRFARS